MDEEIEIDDGAEPSNAALERQAKAVTEVWEIANVALDHYREKKVIFISELETNGCKSAMYLTNPSISKYLRT